MNKAEITLARGRYGRTVAFAGVMLFLALGAFEARLDYEGWARFAFAVLASVLCSVAVHLTVRAATWHTAIMMAEGAEKAQMARR